MAQYAVLSNHSDVSTPNRPENRKVTAELTNSPTLCLKTLVILGSNVIQDGCVEARTDQVKTSKIPLSLSVEDSRSVTIFPPSELPDQSSSSITKHAQLKLRKPVFSSPRFCIVRHRCSTVLTSA